MAVWALGGERASGAGSVALPGDTYAQGNPILHEGSADEGPARSVTLAPFRLGRTEVTWAEWVAVRAWAVAHGYADLADKGYGKASDHPVLNISWFDAVLWCNARSERDGLTPVYMTSPTQAEVLRSGTTPLTAAHVRWSANGYRLPTEAEWEAAARGGLTNRRFGTGDTLDHTQANFFSSSADAYDTNPMRDQAHPAAAADGWPFTTPVTAHSPNAYGFHGLAGNALEWCWDRYAADSYSTSPTLSPTGPETGRLRVLRGGSWHAPAAHARASRRDADRPDSAHYGFRVAQSVPVSEGAPMVVQEPATVRTASGQTIALTVVATGTGSFTYAWTRDGVTLPEATGPRLVLPAAAIEDTGVYRVTVTSLAGTTATTAMVVAIDGHQTFASWALDRQLPGTEPNADTDGDGWADLLEFAMGTDPASPGQHPALPLSLAHGSEIGLVDPDRTYGLLSVPVDPLSLGVTLVAEVTDALGDWTRLPGGLTLHGVAQHEGHAQWIYRTTEPTDLDALPRFFRVRVDLP